MSGLPVKAKKSSVIHKLKIARGQIDGILQMIEEDRYCVDISTQLQATQSLLKNANQVSSFCNDVVGDICGIVSGSTAAVIVVELQKDLSTTSILISIAVTALISGITIGGKALGKTVAINECTGVVYRVARLMHTLHLYR